jgi:hypothetical protein
MGFIRTKTTDPKFFGPLKALLTILLFPVILSGQDSIKPLSFSGYTEVYYSYDFGNPPDHLRPVFLYNYNRHNEVNLNLGFIKAAYNARRVRGNLAFMAGTYAEYNLASEGIFRNVFEANAGARLSAASNLWIDAGIFQSHIGFESAIGKDCWNLTRSILADNSPYYESGVRISFLSKSEKLYVAALALNGWQRIKRVYGNQTPAIGTQLTVRPTDDIIFNWSTYAGNERPDTAARWRYFNNFYCQWQTALVGVTVGFDYGLEQAAKHSAIYNHWYAPVAIVQFHAAPKCNISYRWEYFRDDTGVIINAGGNGLRTFGNSVNIDLAPFKNIMWRIEGRALNNFEDIFYFKGGWDFNNYSLTTSLAISFE